MFALHFKLSERAALDQQRAALDQQRVALVEEREAIARERAALVDQREKLRRDITLFEEEADVFAEQKWEFEVQKASDKEADKERMEEIFKLLATRRSIARQLDRLQEVKNVIEAEKIRLCALNKEWEDRHCNAIDLKKIELFNVLLQSNKTLNEMVSLTEGV